MEPWVKDWLDEQRQSGRKCLEIKYIQGKPYVYHSTSRYDKEKKGPKKVSEYLGRLNKEHGFIPKNQPTPQTLNLKVRSAQEYGNTILLNEEFNEILPLIQKYFPDYWHEIVAMVFTRVDGYTPLKRIKDKWEKLYSPKEIAPNCDPKILSEALKSIGSDHAAQHEFFSHLAKSEHQLIYDLSYVFSESENLHIAEYGYNRKKTDLPQVNIALFSSVESGLPVMIRGMPGTIKDVSTLETSLDEIDLKDKLLIMDRGFISEDLLPVFDERNIEYIQPLRRNSTYYSQRIHLTKHLHYHGRLVHCGRRSVDVKWVYVFKDTDLALEEEKTLYRQLDKGTINREELRERLKKAGMMLILSNHDTEPEKIYELYKSREGVEKHFETFKSELGADKMYLRDADSVFGHFFVAFLSLYLYCRLIQRLKKAELNRKYSPKDVLLKLSKVFLINYETRSIMTEVPKQVKNLAEKLELEIVPKK